MAYGKSCGAYLYSCGLNIKLNKLTEPIHIRHFRNSHPLNISVLGGVCKLNQRCIKNNKKYLRPMVNLGVSFCIVVVSTVSNLKLNKLTKQIHTGHFRNDHSLNMSVLDDAFKLNKPCKNNKKICGTW